jgi:hypothetical protein
MSPVLKTATIMDLVDLVVEEVMVGVEVELPDEAAVEFDPPPSEDIAGRMMAFQAGAALWPDCARLLE